MFDIGTSELLIVAVVALLVIGPKDLPRVLHMVGKWIAKARSMTGQFKSGLEQMAREAELEDMEKQWAEHNKRIMTQHPGSDGATSPFASPLPAAQAVEDSSAPPAPDSAPTDSAASQAGSLEAPPSSPAPAEPVSSAATPLPPLPEP